MTNPDRRERSRTITAWIANSRGPWWSSFPLRGERWVAVTTPGDRIPSHGVNMLGQRYAYDLLKVDERKGVHYHPAGWLRGLLIGGRTQECYAWGAAIHSPFDGEIVRAVDGVAERSWIHPVREAALTLKNALTFRPSRLPLILGNHVIARSGDIFAGFAHLAPGSVAVGRADCGCWRGPWSSRTYRQFDLAAPAFPADGLSRPDDREGPPLRLSFLRSVAGRHVAESGERDPCSADRIRYAGAGL